MRVTLKLCSFSEENRGFQADLFMRYRGPSVRAHTPRAGQQRHAGVGREHRVAGVQSVRRGGGHACTRAEPPPECEAHGHGRWATGGGGRGIVVTRSPKGFRERRNRRPRGGGGVSRRQQGRAQRMAAALLGSMPV